MNLYIQTLNNIIFIIMFGYNCSFLIKTTDIDDKTIDFLVSSNFLERSIFERFFSYAHKNQKTEGKYQSWYPGGQLEINYVYKNGKLNGKYRRLTKNGELIERTNYKNGEKEGKSQRWDSEDGELIEECYYKNGKLEGKYRFFVHVYDVIAEVSDYKNGKKKNSVLIEMK